MIDMDEDGVADHLASYESGVTPDGDTIQVHFKTDDGASVPHRAQDNLQVNGTATMDLGPLNLRFSGVVDN